MLLFLFFFGKEKESKETARVPLDPARRRCSRSTRKLARLAAGSNSPCALFRHPRRCSARDNGKLKPKNDQTPLSPLRRGKPEQGALHDPGEIDGLGSCEIGSTQPVMGAAIVAGVFF
jgi:hypothetical protein